MQLPHQTGLRYLTWTGLETDLIFNHGIDLPGFASFPLLEQADTRQILRDLALDQIRVAADRGMGSVLESATWMANRDRAVDLGYGPDRLGAINRDAIALLAEARRAAGQDNVLISANIGPRGDAYLSGAGMTADDAETYHREQIAAVAGPDVDLISAYTLSDCAEAIGIVRAGQGVGIPVVVSFTVETDGRLPDGQGLDDAIAQTDAATGNAAAYFMVNCAHPEHFSEALTGNPRIGGVVVNASRCSHAELDEAEELDAGDPAELAGQLSRLLNAHPSIRVIGGCCGTDRRHLLEMARIV